MMNDLTVVCFSEAMKRLFPCGNGRVLCGFSGGSDSAALLTLLHRFSLTHSDHFSLAAAHVHHGIRGEEADRDAAFCANFCRERNIPFFALSVDVPSYARVHKVGLEEAARVLRYAELRRVCDESGYDFIATAHNATDQLETVLMHLIRGSGIDGLCGMREKNGDVIRPLLSVPKEEILSFCRQEKIPYVTDSTNCDPHYTRNYLRSDVLPLLRRCNPRVEEAAVTLTRALCADRDYLEQLADAHTLREGRSALRALPDAMLHRVIRREFRHDFPDAPMLTRIQCEAAVQAIRSRRSPARVTLPGGGELLCDREEVLLRSVLPNREEAASPKPIVLREGWQTFDRGESMILLRVGILTESDRQKITFFQNIYNLSNIATLKSDTIGKVLTVRARISGDVYFNGRYTKKVRKLLQALPLPAYQRARYPLICTEEEILWIPGFASAAAVDQTETTGIRIVCFFGKNHRKLSPDRMGIQGEKGT